MIIVTKKGTGNKSRYPFPWGLFFDPLKNLCFIEYFNQRRPRIGFRVVVVFKE
eukprot:NODE_21600_length_167_cov_1.330508_g20985_i0.p1 GENE.NODE_21600_length_167_cov_1.330508_g20985_i0~~NODE_21600_length_167_cov_1.330508_g20985_i0.p1  ORF type:complete len:53 (+),score=4.54 NODE_21600_length_167_cov_1.330508_g20985_i0:3-161(+)